MDGSQTGPQHDAGTAPVPRRYRYGAVAVPLLIFRTEYQPDGRILVSLVPDNPEQHPFDVVTCHLDNPSLSEWKEDE